MVLTQGVILSDADIQKYREDGFLIVRDFFSPDYAQQMVQGWHNLNQFLKSDAGRHKRSGLFVGGFIPEETIWNIHCQDALVENARRILKTDDVALYTNRMMIKDEEWNDAIHVHQDMSFWHGTTNKLSVFVPLQPHNESVGGLKLIKGSNRFGHLGIPGTIHPDQFPGELETVGLDLEVGDIAFIDVLTWHFSVKATVPSQRPLLQITYQPANDSSYMLEEPVLVCGEWKTPVHTPLFKGVTPSPYPQARPKAELEEAVEELESKVSHLQAMLDSKQTELEQVHRLAGDLNTQLMQKVSRLDAIETSKFWKLRKGWFKLKRLVGAGGNE